jgi:hypothetical protein
MCHSTVSEAILLHRTDFILYKLYIISLLIARCTDSQDPEKASFLSARQSLVHFVTNIQIFNRSILNFGVTPLTFSSRNEPMNFHSDSRKMIH